MYVYIYICVFVFWGNPIIHKAWIFSSPGLALMYKLKDLKDSYFFGPRQPVAKIVMRGKPGKISSH